jgi:hypothetical protein
MNIAIAASGSCIVKYSRLIVFPSLLAMAYKLFQLVVSIKLLQLYWSRSARVPAIPGVGHPQGP